MFLNDKSPTYGALLKEKRLMAPAYHLNQVKVNATFRTYVCSYQVVKVSDKHQTVQNVCPLACAEWCFGGIVNRRDTGEYKVSLGSAPSPPIGFDRGQIPTFPVTALLQKKADDALVVANEALRLKVVLPE